jgi:Arc/MetJ-type ribon-helix-helix transcriptional regulator
MATMTTTITLTTEQAARLQDHVKDGSFTSADQVVQEFVSQVLDDELIATCYSPSAKARVQAGIEASLRGEVVHHQQIEAFLDDWERELQA